MKEILSCTRKLCSEYVAMDTLLTYTVDVENLLG